MEAGGITLKFGKFECDPCRSIKKKRREAKVFCKNCKECLCQQCQKYHQRVTVTQNHKLLVIQVSQTTSELPQNTRNGQTTATSGLSQNIRNGTVPTLENGAEKLTLTSGRVPEMMTRSNTGFESVTSVSTATTAITTFNVKQTYTKAALADQFNSSLINDELPCEIRGIIFIDDYLVIADMNNNKVKIFDESNSLVCQAPVPSPFDMSALNTGEIQEIAVTSKSRNINILAFKNSTLTDARTISTSLPCYGICYHNDLIYVVCRHHCKVQMPQIQVYTPAGRCRRRIEPISHGGMVLYRPDYITINPQTGNMYITEWNKGVVALSNIGTFISCQLPPNLINSQGVVVAEGGDVFVCGLNSDNVMKLSRDKYKSMELMFTDRRRSVKAPQCLCIKGDKMVVCCRTTDVVRTFLLS